MSDGDRYVGSWKLGKRSGLGIHSRLNGFTYVGEFKNDKPHGKGVTTMKIHHVFQVLGLWREEWMGYSQE